MSEKSFRIEYIRHLKKKYPGALIYPIPDSYRTGLKPFDLFFLNKGRFVALELKYMPSARTFNTNRVLPHQRQALKKVKENGGRAYIVLRCNKRNYYFEIEELLKNKTMRL